MPLYAETYEQVADRFREWMTDRDNSGDFVGDIALDYINRANQVLWGHTFWDDLMTHAALTLSGLAGTFPAAYGRTYCMYHDSDGDGKPDWYYYKDGKPGKGYRLTRTFSRAAGSSFVATFFLSPTNTPYLLYQAVLDDFTGQGTEYIFWPAELLLKTAQCLYKEDADDLGVDYDKLNAARRVLLERHEMGHQFANADYVMDQNDAGGKEVQNEAYALDGGGDGLGNAFRDDNSRDNGLI
jgi:hypothetical protein